MVEDVQEKGMTLILGLKNIPLQNENNGSIDFFHLLSGVELF